MADLALTFLTHLKNGPINDKATTQRTNYPFNSYCKFNGNYYGASTTKGIAKFGGDLDITEAINAYFVPITTDFGSPATKRNTYVNITYNSSGNMYAALTPSGGAKLTYTIAGIVMGLQRLRFKVAEKPKGVFWTYEFGNLAGAYFSVHMIDLEMNFYKVGNKNF